MPTPENVFTTNNKPTLVVVSSSDATTPVKLYADPVTHALVVSSSGASFTNDGTFATPALQTTGNTSLSSMDTKTPALGQALAAASTPVVLTAAQITTLTPLSTVAVTGTFFQATQPVSLATNTPTLQAGSTTAVTQATASNLNATVVGTGTFVTQSTLAAETTKVIGVVRNADGSGNLLTSTTNALDVNLKTSSITLPVSLSSTTITGSVTVTATNLSTNVAQLAGTTTDTNSGSKSAGTLRVVLATDQPALTNKLLVTPDSVALPANQSVNISQMNGVTTSMGAGATGTGVQRVVLANDSGKTLVSAGGSAASSGNNTLVAAGTNKLKVYAFTLSTVSTTAMTCIFQSGAGGTELWRVVLQAATSTSTGANLVVQPPAWLFATASATLLNLNLSSANAVHWSTSYYDEA